MNSHTQQTSHLLVISHCQDDFNGLSQILTHYFRQQSNHDNKMLCIANKYYKAMVKMHNVRWDNALNTSYDRQQQQQDQEQEAEGYLKCQSQSDEQIVQKNQKQPNQQIQDKSNKSNQQSDEQPEQTQGLNDELKVQQKAIKYDLLIMIISQPHDSQIPYSEIDKLILHYNPQQYMILLDTQNPSNSWSYQSTILDKCDNFIQIVKENLNQINKTKPKWMRGCLLNDQEEDDLGIFSLLDRIETTRWATLQNLPFKNNVGENKIIKQQSSSQQNHQQNCSQLQLNAQLYRLNAKQPQQSQPNSQQAQQNHQQRQQNTVKQQKQVIEQVKHSQVSVQTVQVPKGEQQNQQAQSEQKTQQSLQAQMLQFESVMSQMMSFKMQSPNLKDNERKVKAEQLFSKMFKGMK